MPLVHEKLACLLMYYSSDVIERSFDTDNELDTSSGRMSLSPIILDRGKFDESVIKTGAGPSD